MIFGGRIFQSTTIYELRRVSANLQLTANLIARTKYSDSVVFKRPADA